MAKVFFKNESCEVFNGSVRECIGFIKRETRDVRDGMFVNSDAYYLQNHKALRNLCDRKYDDFKAAYDRKKHYLRSCRYYYDEVNNMAVYESPDINGFKYLLKIESDDKKNKYHKAFDDDMLRVHRSELSDLYRKSF